MNKNHLGLEMLKADVEIKKATVELLKAQTRLADAQAKAYARPIESARTTRS